MSELVDGQVASVAGQNGQILRVLSDPAGDHAASVVLP